MLRGQIAKIPDGEYTAPTAWLDDDARNRGVRLRVETKVIVEGDTHHDRRDRLGGGGADGLQRPVRGVVARRRLLRGANAVARRGDVPRARAAERRGVPAGERRSRRRGRSSTRTSRARASRASARSSASWTTRSWRWPTSCPQQVTAGNSAGIHFCSYSGLHAGHGRVLAVPRGQRGLLRRALRQGRHGLRGQPHGQHPQQPDRGARPALPDALRPVRAAARARGAGQVARRRRASSGATASWSTGRTPARATASGTRRAGSSAATTGSWPPSTRTPARTARSTSRRR